MADQQPPPAPPEPPAGGAGGPAVAAAAAGLPSLVPGLLQAGEASALQHKIKTSVW